MIIILNILRKKVEEELSDCQAGYRKDRDKKDRLFIIQQLLDKIKNTKEEAFFTFIDYSKDFESVIHSHLFKTMPDMGFPEHLIQ